MLQNMKNNTLKPGLYEQVINHHIAEEIEDVPEEKKKTEAIDEAEAPGILSQYLEEVIARKFESLEDEKDGLDQQIRLTNKIVHLLDEEDGEAAETEGRQLLALLDPEDIRRAEDIPRPKTSLARSSLFTGAEHEPQMKDEIIREIPSCSRIDLLVSFIKWNGLRLILDDLRAFCEKHPLRVITTAYIGATDLKAVEELSRLPNTEVKISYDTRHTRLHAKAYIFERDNGFTTAYVGSSNLSNPALTSGLEWNLKVTAKDQPHTIAKIRASFESYWHASEFETYDASKRDYLAEVLRSERQPEAKSQIHYLLDIRPYPYQQEILDALQADREIRHHRRSLVVAATGTGKTVIAALDYRNYIKEHPERPCRLLFVAHRKEILVQSMEKFREVLKDANFGDLYVGQYHPVNFDHLFVSIQTMNSQKLYEKLPADYYDCIVVDEFHHAAADTYRKMLAYFKPQILLGLTATPERADGKSILDYFDGRIAAEIRLPEAIDRELLCPFQYFGVSDQVSLDHVHWIRGGYDEKELNRLYTESPDAEKRAEDILRAVQRYSADIDDVRGLGFCVSVAHARYMAERFRAMGVPSLAVSAESRDEERETAKEKLEKGEIRFIFAADLYNEGVDIPEINTVLFLRPTASLTVFLQQLGRGLRRSENKDCLTVLDFVGQANRKYNFEEKYQALLEVSTHSLRSEIERGFPSVPKGCSIQLEKMAMQYVLENIRQYFDTRNGLISRIRSFTEDTDKPLSLTAFVKYYHLDMRRIYARDTWSNLCVSAGVKEPFHEPLAEPMAKAMKHLCQIDSVKWITFLQGILRDIGHIHPEQMDGAEERMFRMFYITMFGEMPVYHSDTYRKNMLALQNSPVLTDELKEVLAMRLDSIDLIGRDPELPYVCPLEVYCTYTRDQLLAGLGCDQPQNVREGVKWLEKIQTDVLLVTLNKTNKDYSPTTMYEDYSVSDTLFHWQSQSTVSPQSKTGRRYRNQVQMGTHVLLFVRENKTDPMKTGAEMFTFLGPCTYVSSSGSMPMNILWKLTYPIPAKFLRKTNQLVS